MTRLSSTLQAPLPSVLQHVCVHPQVLLPLACFLSLPLGRAIVEGFIPTLLCAIRFTSAGVQNFLHVTLWYFDLSPHHSNYYLGKCRNVTML